MALYVHTHRDNLMSIKTILWLWHAVGSFGAATAHYLGMDTFQHSLGYMCFSPITLICYYQVPWAIGIHILYLTKMDAILEAQKVNPKKKAK